MQSLAITFFIRGTRLNSEGKTPIYCRITLDGKISQFSISRWVSPDKWNGKAAQVKGTTKDVKELNFFISDTKSKILTIHTRLTNQGVPFTADTIRNELQGTAKKVNTLIELINYHNDLLKDRVGKGIAPATVKRFGTLLRQIKDYLNYQYNTNDYPIQNLNFEFLTQYEHYLRTVRQCNNNSALKYIRNLRKIIRIALDNDWLSKDPFSKFKGRLEETEKTFLTDAELNAIMEKEISIQRLDEVRDVFVFCCHTGLAFTDVESLSPEDIFLDMEGKKLIKIKRQKTGTKATIPLFAKALEIIEKYKNHPECKTTNRVLPLKSNQKYNAYLKEFATLCGIKKELTSHVARHTCATRLLNHKMPITSVRDLLGHKNVRQTEVYAKLLESTLMNDAMKVEESISKKQQSRMATNQHTY